MSKVCFASALILGLAALGRAQDSQELALEGATVHTVSGEVLEGATVLVRRGKVAAIGKVELQAGARRIDLSGKHLYPGLIDADTVLGLTEIGSVAGSEDTEEVGRINPNLRAERGLNPDSELLPVTRTGGVLLANIAARSGLIAGTSALVRLSGWTYEDMTLRAPVFLHLRWPRMRIQRLGKSPEEIETSLRAREESLALIRSTFREARAYARAPRGDSGRARDPKWEAMLPVVAPAAGERPLRLAVHVETQAQIEAALDWASQEGLALVIVGGADSWRLAPRLAKEKIPVILGPLQRLPLRSHEELEAPYRVAARLRAAGVSFAFSTGGSGFEAANARNLRLQAAQAVGQGLSEPDALRALTLDAARILGVDQQVGSIEVGKSATLIVTTLPLLDDRARVVQAWIDGREVSLRDRQLKLFERYQERRR